MAQQCSERRRIAAAVVPEYSRLDRTRCADCAGVSRPQRGSYRASTPTMLELGCQQAKSPLPKTPSSSRTNAAAAQLLLLPADTGCANANSWIMGCCCCWFWLLQTCRRTISTVAADAAPPPLATTASSSPRQTESLLQREITEIDSQPNTNNHFGNTASISYFRMHLFVPIG